MIVEKSMSQPWLSNSWLVADRPGGTAILIDSGGPSEPLERVLAQQQLELTHILYTHHHGDHVLNTPAYRAGRSLAVCAHPLEAELCGGVDRLLEHGEELACGDLSVRVLHVPGHTAGHLAFLVNGERVFTGDVLFRGSVGGTRGRGHTTYADLRRSVMEVLMALPPGTVVHPGHTEPTTIGRELEHNPFVRLWRGLDEPQERPCTALGRPATLVLGARDYDGGQKCLVRYNADGALDIAPGSKVHVIGD